MSKKAMVICIAVFVAILGVSCSFPKGNKLVDDSESTDVEFDAINEPDLLNERIFSEEDYANAVEKLKNETKIDCFQQNILEADGAEVLRDDLTIRTDLDRDYIKWSNSDTLDWNVYDAVADIYYLEEGNELVENHGTIEVLDIDVTAYDTAWDLVKDLLGTDFSEIVGTEGFINNNRFLIDYMRPATSDDLVGVDWDEMDDRIYYLYIFEDDKLVSMSATLGYTKDDVHYKTKTELLISGLGEEVSF